LPVYFYTALSVTLLPTTPPTIAPAVPTGFNIAEPVNAAAEAPTPIPCNTSAVLFRILSVVVGAVASLTLLLVYSSAVSGLGFLPVRLHSLKTLEFDAGVNLNFQSLPHSSTALFENLFPF
jgi:hypothetical protein